HGQARLGALDGRHHPLQPGLRGVAVTPVVTLRFDLLVECVEVLGRGRRVVRSLLDGGSDTQVRRVRVGMREERFQGQNRVHSLRMRRNWPWFDIHITVNWTPWTLFRSLPA